MPIQPVTKGECTCTSESRLMMLLTLRRLTSGNVSRYGVGVGSGSEGIRKTGPSESL